MSQHSLTYNSQSQWQLISWKDLQSAAFNDFIWKSAAKNLKNTSIDLSLKEIEVAIWVTLIEFLGHGDIVIACWAEVNIQYIVA